MTSAPVITRPHYTLQVQTAACGIDARVNDVPAYAADDEGGVSVEIPINLSVLPSRNMVSLRVFPIKDETAWQTNAAASITLYVRASGSGRDTRQALATLSFLNPISDDRSGFESGDGRPLAAGIRITLRDRDRSAEHVFDAAVPWPRWAWADAPVLMGGDSLYAEAAEVYRKLWQALNDRDTQAVSQLTHAKAIDAATAFHQSEPDAGDRLVGLTSRLTDATLTLDPLDLSGMALKTFGNGRLCTIADSDGDGPIVFAEASRTIGHYIKVVLARVDGRRLAIVR